MSLLDTTPSISPAQRAANLALEIPRKLLAANLQAWADGINRVWNPPKGVTTEQVLAAMGTQAGELFQRSAALRAFLESQKPGCTKIAAATLIKPTVANPDGTVALAHASAAKPTT